MKKLIAAAAGVWLFLLAVSPLYAASIPSNLGFVQDRAGYFTDQEKKDLRQEAADDTLQFYVLTIAELDGAASADYATDVYNSWGLHTNDVLIVIADKEHRVEINFYNPALQEKIDALPADFDGDGDASEEKLTEIADKYFIPDAKAGNFAEAVHSLMEGMRDIAPEPAATPAPTAQQAGQAAAAEGTKPNGDTAESSGTGGAGLVGAMLTVAFILFIVVFVAAPFLVIGYFGFRGMSLKRKLKSMQEQFAGLMVSLSRGLEDIAPVADLGQGQTGRLAKDKERRLSELLLETQELQQELQDHRVFFFQLRKLKEAVDITSKALAGHKRQVDEEVKAASAIAAMERETAPLIERLIAENAELAVNVDQLAQTMGSMLSSLKQDTDDIAKELAAAKEEAVFNSLTVIDRARRLESRLAALQSDYKELSEVYGLSLGFPEQERACRQAIGRFIEEQELNEEKFDYYGKVEQSKAQVERLMTALRQGDAHLVRPLWEQADHLLQQAVAEAEQQVEYMLSNREKLRAIDGRQRELERMRLELENEFIRVSKDYAASVWDDLKSQFDGWSDQLTEAAGELEEAKYLSSPEQQQFTEAAERLNELGALVQELEENFKGCSRSIHQWDEDRIALAQRFVSDTESYQACLASMRAGGVIVPDELLREADETVRALSGQYKAAEAARPCPLLEMADYGGEYHETIRSFVMMVQKIAALKMQVEQALEQCDTQFKAAYRESSGISYKSDVKRNYKQLVDQAEMGIQLGNYESAADVVEQIQRFILSMRQANHDRIQAEQERQRQKAAAAAARAASWRSYGSSGSSSSGGGHPKPKRHHHHHDHHHSGGSVFKDKPERKNSSGGSSFGGGGNSSGGSSFGGGGKNSGNSSGGSNW